MTRLVPSFAFGLMLGALPMLAGCDSLSAPKAGPTASGEVLPGTVSDAMLNTDRSRAEALLAPIANGSAETGKQSDVVASSEAAPDASAAAEVAADSESAPVLPPKPKPTTSPKPAAP